MRRGAAEERAGIVDCVEYFECLLAELGGGGYELTAEYVRAGHLMPDTRSEVSGQISPPTPRYSRNPCFCN